MYSILFFFKNYFSTLYKYESLVLIGGVQEKNKSNYIQLLLYKVDGMTTDNGKVPEEYKLVIEHRERKIAEKDFEQDLNEAQVEKNCILRSIIAFEDESISSYFMIMQIY